MREIKREGKIERPREKDLERKREKLTYLLSSETAYFTDCVAFSYKCIAFD